MKKLSAILTSEKIDTIMSWILGASIIIPAAAAIIIPTAAAIRECLSRMA